MVGLKTLQSREVRSYLFYELKNVPETPWLTNASGSVLPSDQESETYAGLGAVHAMRRWEGNRMARRLRPESYVLRNQEYENTLLVTGKEKRRDKTGQVVRRIADLRQRYAQHWERLAVEATLLGESTACYDGQFFFDTDHASGDSGTQDNDLTYNATTATDPTPEEAEQALWAAIQAAMVFKDDTGEPANAGASSFTALIPPAFLRAFTGAVQAPLHARSSAGVSNILAESGFNIDLVASPWLQVGVDQSSGWTTKFALFVNDGRSLIRQDEVPLEVSMKAEGSDFHHDTGNCEYGIFCSRAVGYGDWTSAVLTTFN